METLKLLVGTQEVVRFLAQEVSNNTYLNVMAQYRPCHEAFDIPQLTRPVNRQEFDEAIELAHRYGLNRLDKEHLSLPLRLILR